MQNNDNTSQALEILFLIPARGGSKSIPRKNLQMINGVTLLELAIKSVPFIPSTRSKVVVSSDDEEILLLAAKLGTVPLKRAADASEDTSSANSVILDIENQESLLGDLKDETVIVYLQPTSPLRTKAHVLEALELHNKECMPVVSVTNISEFPQKMFELNEDHRLTSYIRKSNPTANRQELPKLLIPNGAIYIFKFLEFKKNSLFPIEGAIPYLMSQEASIDIDAPLDLKIVRAISD